MNGALIRDTRVALSIPLRELAATLNVTATFLGEVERGKRRVPSDWEARLTREVSAWAPTVRACVESKHPELAELVPARPKGNPSLYGRVTYKGDWNSFYRWFQQMDWSQMPSDYQVQFSFKEPRRKKAT